MVTIQQRRLFSVCAGSFLVGWLLMSSVQLWSVWHHPVRACRSSLQVVYVAAHKVKKDLRGTIPLESVKRILRDGFRLDEEDDQYLSEGRKLGRYVGSRVISQQISLLCPSDPGFAVKVVMIKSPVLDFEPSYRWCPDDRTLAYCPYHHYAMLRDGTIERR